MILVVAGTRPEVIKLAPVYRQLQTRDVDVKWMFSGQQAGIGRSAFEPFGMVPEIEYRLDRPTGSLPELNAVLANAMREVLVEEVPDMVLVQGDTLTAAMAAQAAFLSKTPVGHVEAGLRSWDTGSPFPEEACRVWIDAVADLKFAPTMQARLSLSGNAWVTGNTVVDALRMVKKEPQRKGTYAVVTMHRRENAGAVAEVCRAIKKLAKDRVFDYIVWPVHPNPLVRDIVPKLLRGLRNVEIVEPLPYDKMVNLMRGAQMLLTDSGGLQEEALALGVPCLVMRNETERPEGIATGGAKLVGCDERKIYSWARWLMDNCDEWERMATAPNPYGDGRAAERIAMIVKATLTGRKVDERVGNWKGALA